MKTLLERLDWVLEHRDLTQLGWSKRAGLSTRYLSTLRGRLEAKPDTRADHDAMVKLARAAHVPVAWLEDGQGDPGNLDAGPELQREPLAELAPEDDESPAEAFEPGQRLDEGRRLGLGNTKGGGVDRAARLIPVAPASDGVEVLQSKADRIEDLVTIGARGVGAVLFGRTQTWIRVE